MPVVLHVLRTLFLPFRVRLECFLLAVLGVKPLVLKPCKEPFPAFVSRALLHAPDQTAIRQVEQSHERQALRWWQLSNEPPVNPPSIRSGAYQHRRDCEL